MLLEAGAIDRARGRLSALLESEPNQPDYLYELAMVEERAQRYDVMEALLHRFITLKPDDRQGYNALGYSLADRNIRLQEALQLLEKATQLAPEDPYIMDSLGWVKYRLGDLQTAADLLQRAYDKSPQAEIGAHLGEVLWQLGRRDDARRTWDKARRLDDENGTLKRTLERHGVALPE
jgi:tetratricopeptide (TPR) repeat protein